jgi:hypothetical protein
MPTIPAGISELVEVLRTPELRRKYCFNLENPAMTVDMFQGLVGEEPNRALVFVHPGLVQQLLPMRKNIYVDATFFAVPRNSPFHQLLSIQTRYEGLVRILF